MGFFSELFAPHQQPEARSDGGLPSWAEQIGGSISSAGVSINSEKALSLTPVWSAIQVISNAMGTFPLHTYRRINGGKEVAADYPMYRILHDKPTETLTAFQWRKLMMTFELLWGCGISEVIFDSNGYPVGLKPIHPKNVTPAKTVKGDLVYHVRDDGGKVTVKQPHQLIMFPFYPTLEGGWLSPIQVFRDALGEGISAREFGQASFSQGLRPAAVISGLKGSPDEASRQSIEDYFANFQGLKGTRKVLLLGEGVSLEKVGMPATDLQYLEARKFTVAEVARIFNIPPHMLQDLEKTTSWGTGVSQITQGFLTFCMLAHCNQWEDEINSKLVSVVDPQYFCEFSMDGLLRGDPKERYESYKISASLGVLSINEIRTKENLNPIPNGDVRLVPMNMHTLENAIEGIGNKLDKDKEAEDAN